MTTRPLTSFLVPFALLAVAASGLTGCSMSGATSTGSPAAAASSPTAVSASSASSGAGSSDADGICAWVSVAAVNAATRVSPAFTAQESGTFTNGEPECGFTNVDGSVSVNVTVFDSATDPFNPTQPIMSADPLHAVSGVGDRAAMNNDEVDAAVGSKVLVVETVSEGAFDPEHLVAIAKLFAPHIH